MATVIKRSKKSKNWTMIYQGFDEKTGKLKQVWEKGYTDKGESLRIAQDREEQARKQANGDVDPKAQAIKKEKAKPFASHLEAFRAHIASNARTLNHVNYTVRDVTLCMAHAGITQVAALTEPMVDKWRTHCLNVGYPDHRVRKDPATQPTACRPDSRKTVNRRLASVKAFLKFMKRQGVDSCDLGGYRALHTKGHEKKRRRALTIQETAALLEKCTDDHRREIYRFAVLTGFRRSEVSAMTPACFDFAKGTITISARDAKNKAIDQSIPMHPTLMPQLKELSRGKLPNVRIFKVPNRTDVVPLLHADCAAAGVDTTDIDFHSFRHTYCTRLGEIITNPKLLQQLCRHQDLKTTMIYLHPKAEDAKAAMARMVG